MTSTQTQLTQIKGIRDGLLITVSSGPPHDELLRILEEEIMAKSSFLRNSRIALELHVRKMNRTQMAEVQDLFARNGMVIWAVLSKREATRDAARGLGLATRLPGSQMDLAGNGRPEPIPVTATPKPRTGRQPNALFVKETLRSGQSIDYEGSVVVMGDVNPGAEIVADGDVIVWGKLRGLVHAGANGNKKATISALDLSPTQLRICDKIAVTPKQKRREVIPETAAIKDGQIIAEAWS